MTRVNVTLSAATFTNSGKIGQVQEHGQNIGHLLVQMMKRQKEADGSIQSVRAKIDKQVLTLDVRREEIKILAKELNIAQQRLSKILQIQSSMDTDRDTIAKRITERNEEINRIDQTLQNEKEQLNTMHRRMGVVQDNYDQVCVARNCDYLI